MGSRGYKRSVRGEWKARSENVGRPECVTGANEKATEIVTKRRTHIWKEV